MYLIIKKFTELKLIPKGIYLNPNFVANKRILAAVLKCITIAWFQQITNIIYKYIFNNRLKYHHKQQQMPKFVSLILLLKCLGNIKNRKHLIFFSKADIVPEYGNRDNG